jgi:hypothetical protein
LRACTTELGKIVVKQHGRLSLLALLQGQLSHERRLTMKYYRAYRIIKDTAKKMGVSEKEVYEIACCHPESPEKLWTEYFHYRIRGEISDWMLNFCLDVLTGIIPLVAVKGGV